jgi:hypothetical protein
MELKEALPGEIVNFTYKQPYSGEPKRHLARVQSVRKLDLAEIIRLGKSSKYREYDQEFVRTETLVTCTLPGGITRAFYAERAESCVRPNMGEVMYRVMDIAKRVCPW